MSSARAAPALALLLALGALPAPAQGFTSVPLGSSAHDDVTAIAREAGWPAGAVEALQQAVRAPDFADTRLDPGSKQAGRIDATAAYRPEHHCDRTPGISDAAAFEATVAYVAAQRAEALARANASDGDGAVAALGRALHALQDCYSHSNAVDLPDQQQAFEAALLLHGGGAVPGLRLTGFAPGADDPEAPEGDPWPHRDFAKDSANQNAESKAMLPGDQTKFEAAVALARLATVAFLQEAARALDDGPRATLMHAPKERHGLPDQVHVPGLPPWALAVGLAAVAGAARRRR